MLRTDIKSLEKNKKAKQLRPETLVHYKSLPLLTYPLSKVGIDAIQDYIRSLGTDVFPMPREEYPFDEFMFQPCPGEVAHMRLEDEGEKVSFHVRLFTGNQDSPFVCSGIVTIYVATSAVEIKVVSGQELAKKQMRKSGLLPPKDDPNLEEAIKDDLSTMAIKLIALISYARAKDLYPVTVAKSKVSPKKKVGSKKTSPTSKVRTGPRVIYLNVLPEIGVMDHVSDLPLPKDSSGKRPHARRGFWKTLRSDRFKNHPLYMVPNAIRVRPAWVGDKSKIVDGNIYTVLIKD